jgi:hypothetical protein
MRALQKKLGGGGGAAPPAAPALKKEAAPPAQPAATASRPASGPGAVPAAAAGRPLPEGKPAGGAGPAAAPGSLSAAYSEVLPTFRDVPAGDRHALFAKKLHLCSYTFDFSDASSHVAEKEVKRQTLLELVEYVNTGQGKFTEALSDDITRMLSANLFRALPPSGHETTGVGAGEAFDAEEEEPALEPAWPHLQARRCPPAGSGPLGAGLTGTARVWFGAPAPRAHPPTCLVSPDCVRVPAPLCSQQRHGRQGCEAVHRLRLCAAPAGAV